VKEKVEPSRILSSASTLPFRRHVGRRYQSTFGRALSRKKKWTDRMLLGALKFFMHKSIGDCETEFSIDLARSCQKNLNVPILVFFLDEINLRLILYFSTPGSVGGKSAEENWSRTPVPVVGDEFPVIDHLKDMFFM
jgi:hypothetical protein